MPDGGKRDDFVPFALPDVGQAEIDAMTDAVRSGWLTTGPSAAAFETEFASFLGGDTNAVAVNSATAGLHLALEALGVGPGDEVIVPTWTFTASAEVVRYLGADPILVDVDPVTLNVDFEAAASAVTERSKAVIPVHFAGLAIDGAELRDFSRRFGLHVIEDAAHALPATSGGRLVGAGDSDAIAFSFYATKTMTTGEGGMVVLPSSELAQRVRTMRLHGISRDVFDRYRSNVPSWRYEVVAPGFKYNLSDPAAAMGRVQLTRVSEMADRRTSIAGRYDDAFAALPIDLPARGGEGDRHSWHLYVIRLHPDAPVVRDEFIEEMSRRGVGCSVHFIPLHSHPYWRDRYALRDEQFPVATEEFKRVVSLPIFSSMTSEQVERVINAVRAVVG